MLSTEEDETEDESNDAAEVFYRKVC